LGRVQGVHGGGGDGQVHVEQAGQGGPAVGGGGLVAGPAAGGGAGPGGGGGGGRPRRVAAKDPAQGGRVGPAGGEGGGGRPGAGAYESRSWLGCSATSRSTRCRSAGSCW